MTPNLFCRVVDGTAEPPGPLPFAATTSAGEPRTDLWGQYEAGHLTLSDIADMDLWPATLDEVAFDPETEVATDLVMTLDKRWKKVAAVRGKRALTPEELAERDAIRNPVPDDPTLGDWRVALVLWKRLPEVLARIKALVDAGNPLGVVAQERVEYSNHVQRAQLMQLKDVFGFTAAEVDESLHRADRVAKGDLSGVWPLPAV